MDLHYRNAKNKLHEAHVLPLAIIQQAQRLYLICRFEGYTNERILALPRIKQARMGLHFDYPADFKLDTYLDSGHFGILRGPQVRLAFHINRAEGLHLLESPLSADQSITEDESGFHISATLPDTELLHRWLRSWGEARRSRIFTSRQWKNHPLELLH